MNAIRREENWVVVDNDGTELFTRQALYEIGFPRPVSIGYSGGKVYLRGWPLQPPGHTRNWPLEYMRNVSLLDEEGEDAVVVETKPLVRVHVAEMDPEILFVYGRREGAPGRTAAMSEIAAYDLPSGERRRGDLPETISHMLMPISRDGWPSFYLLTTGPWNEPTPLTLVEYNRDMERTFSHAVAPKNRRLAFVTTDENTIYIVGQASPGVRPIAYYDVKARKLSSAPLPAPEGPSINGVALGDGRLVVWGRKGFILYNPRTALTRPDQMVTRKLPHERMRLVRRPVAVAGDGRFALAAQHQSPLPKVILVYSGDGALIEQIDVREGHIEHLKFVSEGKELLVFAQKYTARVRLDAEPAPEQELDAPTDR